jgi:predicted GIY-YIG superfamily endonuclease
MTAPDITRPHVLYRAYDKHARLLYIGITLNLGNRMAQHGEDKPWWCDVADIKLEQHDSRTSALEAERQAIISERPLHNVVHNSGRTCLSEARAKRVKENEGRMCVFRDMAGNLRREPLMLSYELNGDPITDDYLPDEISAEALLHIWRRRYVENRWLDPSYVYDDGMRPQHPDSPMPLMWTVLGPAIMEFASPWEMPFPNSPHFLLYYSQPHDAKTGLPIELHELPVINKRWDNVRGDKGGFIQAATGWKPSPMQDWVTPSDIFNHRAIAGRSA